MIIAIIISLFVGAFFGFVMASLLNMTKDTQMDGEEYSLGQEDRIVIIEDVAGSEDQEENEE